MAKRYYLGERAVRALDKALPYIEQQMRTTKFDKRRGTSLFGGRAFLAKITSAGPNGEADFEDARYWAREVINTNSDNDHTSVLTFTYPEKPSGLGMEDWRQVTHWEVATNLKEFNSETHTLSTDDDTLVIVCIEGDQNNLARYYFTEETVGTFAVPYEMLPTTLEGEATAQTDTWNRDDQPEGKDGVIYKGPRVVYDDEAGTPRILGYNREVTWDSVGNIAFIDVEVEYIIDSPEVCP